MSLETIAMIMVRRRRTVLSSAALAIFLASALAQGVPEFSLSRLLPRELRVENQTAVNAAQAILSIARVRGGVVSLEDESPVPQVTVAAGLTVDEALTRVLGGRSKYLWREVDGVLNIVPQREMPLLETIVHEYEWRTSDLVSTSVRSVLRSPLIAARMSELGYVEGLYSITGLTKAPRVGAPPVDARVFVRRNIPLIDLLNEIVRSYSDPAIWHYDESLRGQTRVITLTAH